MGVLTICLHEMRLQRCNASFIFPCHQRNNPCERTNATFEPSHSFSKRSDEVAIQHVRQLAKPTVFFYRRKKLKKVSRERVPGTIQKFVANCTHSCSSMFLLTTWIVSDAKTNGTEAHPPSQTWHRHRRHSLFPGLPWSWSMVKKEFNGRFGHVLFGIVIDSHLIPMGASETFEMNSQKNTSVDQLCSKVEQLCFHVCNRDCRWQRH